MKKLITLLLLLLSFQLFAQTIYFVKPTGSDANSGTSWGQAFRTVRMAIQTISSGQIWVAAGTYYPDEIGSSNSDARNSSFMLKNGVALYGGFAGNETALSQRNWRTHVTRLSGDLDKNGDLSNNAYHVIRAELVNNTAIVDGFTISGGNANDYWVIYGDHGGGMLNVSSSPLIANCIFSGNSSTYLGGAVYNGNSRTRVFPTFINCSFTGNTGAYGGGVCNYGMADETGAHEVLATFLQCSFWGNTKGGAIYDGSFATATLANCILWNNTGGSIRGEASVSYSLLQGGYSGPGNLDADPLFRDAAAGDLRLQFASPARNAGNDAVVNVATDLDGRPRISYGRVDMGAYEFQPGDPGSILYVQSSGSDANSGDTWTTAFRTVQKALSTISTGQVWVAAGTYYPDEGPGQDNNARISTFELKNGVALYGGFNGTETDLSQRHWASNVTVLSGDLLKDDTPNWGNSDDNAWHVVSTGSDVTRSTILDGFTITAGRAVFPYPNGGGMKNEKSSPTIRNCRFTGNQAGNRGGAMFNDEEVVSSPSGPLIVNCTFTGNKADFGGAIYNFWSYAAIINCTFTRNYANGQGGAICSNNYDPIIGFTNCILWGNTPDQAEGYYSISYSIVQGGWTGTGNKNTDPLFVNAATGNLHLMPGSPAIDAGNDAAVPSTVFQDLDGHARNQGLHVDMGAYEYASVTPGPHPALGLFCPSDFTLQSNTTSCVAIVDFTGEHAATTKGGKQPVTITYTPAPGTLLPVAENTISVTATDSEGTTQTCSFTITVIDTTAPVITNLTATPSVLYPPNHKLQNVTVNYNVSDNCSVTTELSVTSNEPEYGSGSGDTGPDWQVVNDHMVQLRGERSGNGSDRIYTITITATDASGNTSTATTMVTVPHDSRPPVTMNQAATTKEGGSLVVTAVPNPSADGFTLYTQSPSTLPLSIKVMDETGRMIERRSGVVANGMLTIGNTYRPGVYYVQVVQGDVLQTLKLVKQNR